MSDIHTKRRVWRVQWPAFLLLIFVAGCGSGGSEDSASTSNNCGVNPFTGISNCPPNDATTLASKIVFTPSQNGVYYVRVKRSPSAPPSAGVYGGYQIQITSPR